MAVRRILVPSLLGAAAVAGALLVLTPSPLTFRVDGQVEGGDSFFVSDATDGAQIRFSDGTEARFDSGARGRIAETDHRGAHLGLEEGRLRMRVKKRVGARWTVDAGPYVVKVTGTDFDVSWARTHQQLNVALYTGAVVVRRVASGESWTLRPGQLLTADVAGRAVRIVEMSSSLRFPAHQVSEPVDLIEHHRDVVAKASSVPPRPSPAVRPTERRWAAHIAKGDHRRVLREAEAYGIDRLLRAGRNEELTALGDAARWARKTELARRAWLAQRARYARSEEARQAAFLLGQLIEDLEGRASEAVRWYDLYLVESPSGVYAADALGRKMVAIEKVHGVTRSGEVAREYLRRFPQGTYAEAARELVARSR